MDSVVIWPCLVPIDFWKEARTNFGQIKPLFWLAECEEIMYHEVFDATYTWKMVHIMEAYLEKIQRHAGTHTGIILLQASVSGGLPCVHILLQTMTRIPIAELNMKDWEMRLLPFAVFCCLYDGLPLIYSGQELPNLKRLIVF